ncbi:MAG TPA: hypothetical protein VG269_02080 [Tepidisphaeraceae bacterium]|jgi:chromosome segregation ATPase|nr:hypothetical protein [Tepidisphaeraceae bacterium]
MLPRTIRTALIAAAFAGLPVVARAVPNNTGPNSALASGAKQVADARADLEKANKQMLVIKKRVSSTFEAKEEWKTAKDAVKESKAELEAAKKPVLEALVKKPEYISASGKRDAAQAAMDEANKPAAPGSEDSDKPKPDPAAAAQAYTNAVLEMKKMNKEALEEDPKIVTAQQKYNDALAAYEALQVQVDDAVKLDPEYASAQQAVTAAEERYKQARESQAAAAKAAADAAAAAAKSKAPSHPPKSSSSSYGR